MISIYQIFALDSMKRKKSSLTLYLNIKTRSQKEVKQKQYFGPISFKTDA